MRKCTQYIEAHKVSCFSLTRLTNRWIYISASSFDSPSWHRLKYIGSGYISRLSKKFNLGLVNIKVDGGTSDAPARLGLHCTHMF